jgi:hypothetical protein
LKDTVPQPAFPPGTTTVVVPRRITYGTVAGLFLVVVVGGTALHRMIWGRADGGTGAFLLCVAAGLVAHEGLHGLGMLVGGVPLREVRFGIQLSRSGAFATTAVPMSVRAYRLACALPLVVLGVVPLVLGFVSGLQLAARFGAVMITVAGGDLAILVALRRVPGEARVLDHATEPGFHLLAPEEAPTRDR